MIRRQPGGVPSSLDGPDSASGRELADVIAFFAVAANEEESYSFKAYKRPDVLDALLQLFGTKCAYCESPYLATAPTDVEHYRPKGGVDVGDRLKKPGYYWLAADWMNLLPSCIDCNRSRTHDFPEAGPELRGKANRFPIGNPTQRATAPGQEAREQRLLLHPYLDDPEEHLEFIGEGLIRPANRQGQVSEMGRESILVYGLDRPALTDTRRWVLKMMEGLMERIREAQQQLQAGIDPAFAQYLERSIRSDVAQLKSFENADRPYSAMAHQAIARFMREAGIPDQ